MAAVALSETIQIIIMQARYKASISADLQHYLELREFYGVFETRFLEVFCQCFIGQIINFRKILVNLSTARSTADISDPNFCSLPVQL